MGTTVAALGSSKIAIAPGTTSRAIPVAVILAASNLTEAVASIVLGAAVSCAVSRVMRCSVITFIRMGVAVSVAVFSSARVWTTN